MVAEDDAELRAGLVRHLEASGYRVSAVDNAFELAALLSCGDRIDVLLLDLRLGDANALDVVERHASDGSVPAVLMSGQLRPRDVTRARAVGIEAILQKPVHLGELDAALLQALEAATSVRGSFHGLSLLDLLQAFHMAQRTIALSVSGSPHGALTLVRGELVRANCGPLEGVDALEQLLQRETATVNTHPVPDGGVVSANLPSASFDMLVLDALRRIDESGRPQTLPPPDEQAEEAMSALEEEEGGSIFVSSFPPALRADDGAASLLAPDRAQAAEPPPPELEPLDTHAMLGGALPHVDQGMTTSSGVHWFSPPSAHVQELATALVGHPFSGRWQSGSWMIVSQPKPDGVAIGFFGDGPRVAGMTLASRVDSQRFCAAVVRLSELTRGSVTETGDRTENADSSDGHDEASCRVATTLLERFPAIAACAIMRSGGAVGFASSTPTRNVGRARWEMVRQLEEALRMHDAELLTGTTEPDCGVIAAGCVGADLLLIEGSPGQLVGGVLAAWRMCARWLDAEG